jgi:DnaJ homologue, subfamily C, member 28, conserved domain
MGETWIERRIRDAIESGELEPYEEVGEPIAGLDNDPLWWVKQWVERERLRDVRRERAPRREEPRDPVDR